MSFDPTDILTEDEILDLYLKQAKDGVQAFPFPTLESLLVDERGFGLKSATSLQRAICRAIEGLPLEDLWNDPAVRRSFGESPPTPGTVPAEVIIVAGVRTAKSMLAAAKAIWASQHCDLSLLGPGEIPRYSILSLEKDNARVVMGHLLGVLSKPAFAPYRITKAETSDWKRLIAETGADDIVGSEYIWHPSGRPVEIRVVAGKRAGGSLVSRWSIGCALDEAPRMVGSDEAIINYDDARNAVRTRLLPGAQIFSLGSPWQPYGPIYDIVQTEWGNPSPNRVVIKARGPDMNPFWWTEKRCDEIRLDPRNRMSYQTDVLAEFADAEEAMFPQALLNSCSRNGADFLPYVAGRDYIAAMDPATRGNAWTLVVADRVGPKKRIVAATQWMGSSLNPLVPKEVLSAAKDLLKQYHLDWCYTDQWAADALRDIAGDLGLSLIIEELPKQEVALAYGSLSQSMAQGNIELPRDPQLQKDLKLIKRRPTGGGFGYTINLPVTPDGRHCDYAPALVLALKHWLDDEKPVALEVGQPGFEEQEMARLEQIEMDAFEKRKHAPWWAPEGDLSNDLDNLETGNESIESWLG